MMFVLETHKTVMKREFLRVNRYSSFLTIFVSLPQDFVRAGVSGFPFSAKQFILNKAPVNKASMKRKKTLATILGLFILLVAVTTTTYAQCSDQSKQENGNNTTISAMKIGVIIETKDYEKAWNAFRFAIVAKNQGYEVKVFLMGEGVECVGLTHDKYNVDEKLNEFVDMGGTVLACGTCLRSRNMNGTETCPMSNMVTCVEMVA